MLQCDVVLGCTGAAVWCRTVPVLQCGVGLYRCCSVVWCWLYRCCSVVSGCTGAAVWCRTVPVLQCGVVSDCTGAAVWCRNVPVLQCGVGLYRCCSVVSDCTGAAVWCGVGLYRCCSVVSECTGAAVWCRTVPVLQCGVGLYRCCSVVSDSTGAAVWCLADGWLVGSVDVLQVDQHQVASIIAQALQRREGGSDGSGDGGGDGVLPMPPDTPEALQLTGRDGSPEQQQQQQPTIEIVQEPLELTVQVSCLCPGSVQCYGVNMVLRKIELLIVSRY